MYALLSLVISVLLQPLSWLLLLLVALAFCRAPKWRRRLIGTTLAIAVVFTNPWLHHTVSNAWEPAPLAIADLDPPFDDAVVLGGFTRLHASPPDRLHLNADANRFTQAVELHHLGKVKRLVFVSGGKTSTKPPRAEADLAARTAERFGVPASAIVSLPTSRNTHENAEEYRAFLEESGPVDDGRRLLLVTSAFHARRAAACFRRAGLEVTVFPTDHRSERDHPGRRLSPGNTVLPSPGTLTAWGPLFREWFGLLVYRVRGWI